MSMLALEIIAAPDSDFLGAWRFHKSLVVLGGRGSDVPLADASGAQLVLEAQTDHVRATPSAELAFWRLNGKRATLPKRVRAGDVIEFCGTRLKLVEASFQPREGKKALLERRLQILKASADPVLEVVKALTARTR
jgi:hypothetical protein